MIIENLLEYIILGVVLVFCLVYMIRKARRKFGVSADDGCSGCYGCGNAPPSCDGDDTAKVKAAQDLRQPTLD